MDRTQWAFAPYTEADLQKQIDAAPTIYGAEGAQSSRRRRRLRRRHQRLHRRGARCDPTLLPAEYAAFGKLPQHWKVTDVIADGLADRRHLRQGRRPRGRLGADAAGASTQRFGRTRGPARLARLPLQERPRGADHGRAARFPYQTGQRRSPSAAWRCPTAARSSRSRRSRPPRPRRRLATPSTRHRSLRRRAARAARRAAARVQLGDGQRRELAQRATRSASSARRSATTCRRS